MRSVILENATRLLAGLLMVFSVFMLLRGHNSPGGGFIGGLIGATGFVVYAISTGCEETRRALRVEPLSIALVGLALALLAALLPALSGDGFFVGQWAFIGRGAVEERFPVSTVLMFDIGVYLAVFGALLSVVLGLEEASEKWR